MRTVVTAFLPLVLAPFAGAQEEVQNPFRPFDQAAFEAHARALGADDARIAAFRTESEESSVGVAADLLLRDLVPSLGDAVELALDADPRAALALAELVSTTEDPMVRGMARYHLARVFLDADDPEKSVELLADYLRHDKNRLPLDAEAAFFYATSLAEIPMADAAARAFADYLELFPAAPERMRALAAQRRAELEAQFQNPLHDIADDMKRSERDIDDREFGKPLQEQQEQLLGKLEEIIEQLEERERQMMGAPGGNSPSPTPAAKSATPEGASRVGSLHEVPGVADRWGNVNDRDREAIESEVEMKLPGRMRSLLRDYYDKLGRDREQ